MQMVLETQRMGLRRFTPADVANLIGLGADLQVIQSALLPAFLRSYEPFPGFGVFAAVKKPHAEFLGVFSFRPTNVACTEVELGYWLLQAVWGQGYATEGARALIRQGFTQQGVQRVCAWTSQDDLASCRVLEKAGLSPVRTQQITERELVQEVASSSPLKAYALLKADWEQ